jgi:hypothetical protein
MTLKNNNLEKCEKYIDKSKVEVLYYPKKILLIISDTQL